MKPGNAPGGPSAQLTADLHSFVSSLKAVLFHVGLEAAGLQMKIA